MESPGSRRTFYAVLGGRAVAGQRLVCAHGSWIAPTARATMTNDERARNQLRHTNT